MYLSYYECSTIWVYAAVRAEGSNAEHSLYTHTHTHTQAVTLRFLPTHGIICVTCDTTLRVTDTHPVKECA